MAPYVWVEQIERDLEAGAWKVIAEARESGTAGIYRANGELRTGLIDEIAHAIDPDAPDLRRAAAARSRCGCSSTSAPSATSATSPPPTCSRWRRCASGLRSDTVERFALGGGGLSERPRGRGSAARAGPRRAASADPLAQVVFALLVLACFAAFFVTQRLKHTPTVVQNVQADALLLADPGRPRQRRRRSPSSSPAPTRVTVTIIDSAGDIVATLCATTRCPATNSSRCAGTGAAAAPHGYTRCSTSPTRHARSCCPTTRARSRPPANTACA